MHSHRNTFVISASPLYYNVISVYIWLFLCCSIRKKYGVKRVVFSSPIYHWPTMTGYINVPFILDPREGMWSASKCTMNKVKEIKKRTNQTCLLTNMLSGQAASHFMMKTTTTATSATSATTTWSQWKNCGRAWERKKGCSLTRRLRLKVLCICKLWS